MDIAYPKIRVQLTSTDENVFSVIAKVSTALRNNAGPAAAAVFAETAMNCSTYDEVLQLAIRTVNIY